MLADFLQTKLCCADCHSQQCCKFHDDRLNDGVTIYFIVAKPRGSSETLFRFLQQVRSEYDALYYMSCGVRMDSRAVCVWTAKKQKRKYISGIAAMTGGQILVNQ